MCKNCKELFKFSAIIEKFSKKMLKRNKGADIHIPTTAVRKNGLVSSYITTKKRYEKNMKKNMLLFQTGKLSKDEYLKLQKVEIQKAFTAAYSLGKNFGVGKSVLDDTERRFIVQQVTKEMGFMENFANDISNNAGKMPYDRRLGMYVDSLDSMFGFGRLVYLPEEVHIIWTLGITDKHCLDCLTFAAKNPYTKKTLPGFPKSGNSRCLANCLCSLTYIYNKQEISSDYDRFILDRKFAVTGNKKIPSEYDYKHLMGLRDEYYYNRYMFELTKDNKYQQAYLDSLKEFTDYKRKNQVYFPVYFKVKENLNELKAFNTNTKFSFTSDYNTLRAGNFVSFFQGNKQMYGRIVSMYGTQARIKTLEGIEYLVTSSTHVLFKEV